MDISPIIKDDFIVLDEKANVSELIGQMRKFEKRSCVVFQNNKYLGLIEKKKMLRSRLDTLEAKVRKYVKRSPIVNEKAEVIATANLMFNNDTEFLPVEKEKQIIGVIEGLDLARLASGLPEFKKITIDEIKLLKSVKVKKDAPIAEAIDFMHDECVDHIPVFEGEKLYGIISYKDILRKYLNWSPHSDNSRKFNKMASTRSAEVDMPHLASLPISNFSTNDNLTYIPAKEKLSKALELMMKYNVGALLVVEGKDFKGVLTIKNILGKIGKIRPVQNYILQFIGLKELSLTEHQQAMLKKICTLEAPKLHRFIHHEFTVVIHIKDHGKQGKQSNYSVHMRLEFPGQMVTVSQEDWNLETALHKTFANAENMLEGKFSLGKKKGKISRKEGF